MGIKFRYLGWTAFELTMENGLRIILDPMLQGRPSEDVPPSPVGIEEFDDVDIVMVSHVAADHVGQAFDIMKRSKAKLVCDMSTRFKALAAGIQPERILFMVSGVRFKIADIHVKALPATHLSFSQLGENQFINSQPLSYLITAPSGERMFFGGDTSISADHKLFGELYKPDVAMLGVGGVNVLGQSFTELYPDEAALLAKWLGVELVFPMHYRFDEGRELANELAKQAPNVKTILLSPGESHVWAKERSKQKELA